MASGNKLGNGAQDGKRDAQFLHRAFDHVRAHLTMYLDDSQMKRVDELNIKASLPPAQGISERRTRYAHVFAPGDVTDPTTGAVSEGYSVCVGPVTDGPGRVLGLAKALVKAAFHKNGKAKDCQRVCGEMGFTNVDLHDIEASTALRDFAAEVANNSGKPGQTITKRVGQKQGTPAVKIGCACLSEKGKQFHTRVHHSMANILIGTLHTGFREDGTPACGKDFQNLDSATYKVKGTPTTASAAA